MGFIFILIQDEQQILHDKKIAMMTYLADVFGLKAETIQVIWHYENGKYMPEVALPKIEQATEEEIRVVITKMYKEARRDLIVKFAENRQTRFHGP